MSSETEPESTTNESEAGDADEDQRAIENTSSLVNISEKSGTIRKSLLRDEMLINAQKFTSQV